MLKRFKMTLFILACMFISFGSVHAEEWFYQRMYLTSHHVMNYSNERGALGRANLHVIQGNESGNSMLTYCADVDTGGYAGSYSKSVLDSSAYDGNGLRLTAILASSYPYVSLEEMRALYYEQTGNSIDGLTYQEAIYATQATVWTITNGNHAPYTFAGNIGDDEMLDLTHTNGLHCNWAVIGPNEEGYCYPNVDSTYYDRDEAAVSARVNAVVNWLLSMDGSQMTDSGNVSINVISKSLTYDNSKGENIAKVSFSLDFDNLTTISSLADINVLVTDSNGNEIDVDYSDGVYSFYNLYPGDMKDVKFNISVEYSNSYAATAYLYQSSGNQDLVGVETNGVNKSASILVDISRTGIGDVEVSKSAITGGPEIEGARLTIKDSNGNVIDTWISGGEPHVVKGLQEGKYTLTEELAPEGYSTASTIEFEIKDGEVTSINMIDEVTKLLIIKKDCYDKEVIGSKFKLIDSNGNVIYEWISKEGGEYIEKIKVGFYTVVEVVYPTGSSEGIETSRVSIEVKDTGAKQVIELTDNSVCKLTNVPKTGIVKSMGLGISVIALGGLVIISSRKKEA